jgi:hypothetical protein
LPPSSVRTSQQQEFEPGGIQSALGQLSNAGRRTFSFGLDLAERKFLRIVNFESDPAARMIQAFGERQAIDRASDQGIAGV